MWSELEGFAERYLVRLVALILFFTGFPLLTTVIFSFAAGDLVQTAAFFVASVGFLVSSAMILEARFGRDAITILAISSTWPFVLFLLFNLSFTAVYAHQVYAALKSEAAEFFFGDVVARVFAGYERIVPKLWVSAVLYGAATLGLWIGRRAQRRFRQDQSRTDRER